jgi:hypothetical protein
MRKIFVLLVCLSVATACFATTFYPCSPVIVRGPQGRPIPNASVSVLTSAGQPADVYANSTGTTVYPNTLGPFGVMQFYAAPGDYTVTVSGGGVTQSFIVTIPTTATSAVVDNDFTVFPGYMYVASAGTYSVIKSNLNANAAPDPNNDTTEGYVPGSMWIDRTHYTAYIATAVNTGNAEWLSIGGTSGITSIDGQTDSAQTFNIGSSGTSPDWVAASGVHTLNIPSADPNVTRGLVTNSSQSISGSKRFTGTLTTFDKNIVTNYTGGNSYFTILKNDAATPLLNASTVLDRVTVGGATTVWTPGVLNAVSSDITPPMYIGSNGGATALSIQQSAADITDPVVYVNNIGGNSSAALLQLNSEADSNGTAITGTVGGVATFSIAPTGAFYGRQTLGHDGYITYGFSGDTTTGIGSHLDGEITLLSNGSATMRSTSSGIKVEGIAGSTNKLVCINSSGYLDICADDPNSIGECNCGG